MWLSFIFIAVFCAKSFVHLSILYVVYPRQLVSPTCNIGPGIHSGVRLRKFAFQLSIVHLIRKSKSCHYAHDRIQKRILLQWDFWLFPWCLMSAIAISSSRLDGLPAGWTNTTETSILAEVLGWGSEDETYQMTKSPDPPPINRALGPKYGNEGIPRFPQPHD